MAHLPGLQVLVERRLAPFWIDVVLCVLLVLGAAVLEVLLVNVILYLERGLRERLKEWTWRREVSAHPEVPFL